MPKIEVAWDSYLNETTDRLSEGLLLASLDPEGKPNAMAIGWGSVGIVWSRPMFVVLVRHSRYTYECIEASGDFTVNVPSPDMVEAVNFCGTVSGRDHDKFAECGFTVGQSQTRRTSPPKSLTSSTAAGTSTASTSARSCAPSPKRPSPADTDKNRAVAQPLQLSRDRSKVACCDHIGCLRGNRMNSIATIRVISWRAVRAALWFVMRYVLLIAVAGCNSPDDSTAASRLGASVHYRVSQPD